MGNLVEWVEIPSVDFERAVKFYSTVFKLDFKIHDTQKIASYMNMEGPSVHIIHIDGLTPSGNGCEVCFRVPDSVDATIARVEQMNGKVITPKKIIGDNESYMAVCADSENNKFTIQEFKPKKTIKKSITSFIHGFIIACIIASICLISILALVVGEFRLLGIGISFLIYGVLLTCFFYSKINRWWSKIST